MRELHWKRRGRERPIQREIVRIVVRRKDLSASLEIVVVLGPKRFLREWLASKLMRLAARVGGFKRVKFVRADGSDRVNEWFPDKRLHRVLDSFLRRFT